jgi:predicted RecB family nuclease
MPKRCRICQRAPRCNATAIDRLADRLFEGILE